ncbi:MAG: hypothetical protein KDD73_07940 [Anaerolineales bacterium]|nr:hypothetical protein [Anaerolineales bacterium]MCB9127161.1 glucose-6-phosphate isomerase [Ardenticatenales bacterium]MCB9171921.1 glucose-6-phosphate isomerase [Ardenticatenales bacterium]
MRDFISSHCQLGEYEAAVRERLAALDHDAGNVAARLWAQDASLWSDVRDVQAKILNRLGWLSSPLTMAARLSEFGRLDTTNIDDGVLLGMGGSSLAPELFQRVFGNADGRPRLHVLDNTTPGAVRAVQEAVALDRTLFIVASKSGTTTETKSFADYFFEQTGGAGERFIAITDPGSVLIDWAKQEGATLFLNPQDIGGRYSALSFFGLVPAALIGVDIATLLQRAVDAIHAGSAAPTAAHHVAVALGTIMAELARQGRDKLTLIASPPLAAFGDWAEQLVAESTGKQGHGTLPIVGESVGRPDVYGADRLFVYLRLAGDATHDGAVDALRAAGQPVVQLDLADKYDLGAQFFIWEFATAVAGVVLGINPFDEPNVTESKTNSKKLLAQFEAEGTLPEPEAVLAQAGVALSGSVTGDSVTTALAHFVDGVGAGDYLAIMAYLPMTEANERALRRLQNAIRDRSHAATTLGFGPRFLHSTGQYHKGGPAQGHFIQIVAEERGEPLPIPDQPFDFGTLVAAQALGDLEALQSRDYPTLRLALSGGDSAALIAELAASL